MVKSYREDCNDAKAARRGLVDQRPIGGRSKREKPVIVEYRCTAEWANKAPWSKRDWRKFGAYRNKSEAEKVVTSQTRKDVGFREYRIKEDDK